MLTAADLADGKLGLLAVIVKAGLAASNGEAKRLVIQGAVELAGERLTDPRAHIAPVDGAVLRCGKRGFARLRCK